jgi:hypothetical protein
VNGVTALFSTDIDNFLNVANYSKVEFDKLYLFLGGNTANNGVTGGVATKIGGNYLAFYTSGYFFPQGGTDVLDEGDVSDGERYEDRTFQWNNVYSFLWGSPAVGGVRLDFAFNDGSSPNNNYVEKKGNTYTENKAFVTAVRWSGVKFGEFSLKPTVAFQWPSYAKKVSNADPAPDVDTEEAWDKAALDIKLDAGYGNFAGYYELLANFGYTQKGVIGPTKGYEYTSPGYAVHTLQVGYTATYDADEKIQFKARPRLTAQLYTKTDITKRDYEDRPAADDGEYDNGTQAALRLTPTVELGVSWKLLPKLTLYTGTTVTPFQLTTYDTTEGEEGSSSQNEKKSYLSGATAGGLNFGFEFNPSPALGIEFSVTNDNVNLSSGTYSLDITSYSGRFAVKVKL